MSHLETSIRSILSGKVNFDFLDFDHSSSYATSSHSTYNSDPDAASNVSQKPFQSQNPMILPSSSRYRKYEPSNTNPPSRSESTTSLSLCFSVTATKDGIEGKRPGRMLGTGFGSTVYNPVFEGNFDSNYSIGSVFSESRASLVGPLALQVGAGCGLGSVSTCSFSSFGTTNAECDGDSAGHGPVIPQLPTTSSMSLNEKMKLLSPSVIQARLP